MIRKLSPLLVLAILSTPLPLAADDRSASHVSDRSERFNENAFDYEEGGTDEGPFEGRPLPPSFEVLPLSAAARIVEERFSGKLIAARLAPPTPREWRQGVQLVHELRLLTPRRDVLAIRLDARNGRFLEVAGTGLAEARKKKVTKP